MDSKTRLRKLAEAATIRIESNIPIRYQNMYLGGYSGIYINGENIQTNYSGFYESTKYYHK